MKKSLKIKKKMKFPPKFFSWSKNCRHVEKSRHFGFLSKITFTKIILHISARSVQKIRTLGLQTQLLNAHDQEIVISRLCAILRLCEQYFLIQIC
jgi:hypothetical protein